MSVSKVSLKENEKYNKKKNVFLEKKKKWREKKTPQKKKNSVSLIEDTNVPRYPLHIFQAWDRLFADSTW